MALTPKQQLFVEEYLIDLNATQAAIRAGYSPNNADKIGSELLGKTRVSEAIKIAMAERSRRTGINQDRILAELAKIALVNPARVVNFDEATIREDALPEDLAAVASVKVKRFPTKDGEGIEREVKFHDKNKALDLAGRHLGMFKDRLELSGSLETEKTKLDDLIQQMRKDNA
jgi:phage terminase small subunit